MNVLPGSKVNTHKVNLFGHLLFVLHFVFCINLYNRYFNKKSYKWIDELSLPI